jgi:D-aminoacyl-tRNA deacylase
VSRAQVTVDGQIHGQIGAGLVVLLGVAVDDTSDDVRAMADKIVGLRVFDDAAGVMNLGLSDAGGAMLVISQFTLLGDCRKGRRPSYVAAAPPERADALYQEFIAAVRARDVEVATGKFRADMQVELVNDGPVTLIIDTHRNF